MDKKRLSKIKLLVFDVDGVFTPGTMPYTEKGDEFKVFHTYDGQACELMRIAGYIQQKQYIFAIISGEDTYMVEKRFRKLRFNEIHLGVDHKLEVLEEIKKKYGIGSKEEIAFFGDDINDIPLLKNSGIRIIASNAPEMSKIYMKKLGLIDYMTEQRGGEGAVREGMDMMMDSLGIWEKAVELRLDPVKCAEFKKWQQKNYSTNVKHYKK
ncbi:MAG: HAD hydrolase family protein [Nanoarchaeota archaeon]|nr:HAD hydrolase family protein [Nanoarchaeota archaeon]